MGTKTIDHVIANRTVWSCSSISDYDTPYTITKTLIPKYQIRHTCIRYMKMFDIDKLTEDFEQVSFSIVYSFDEPEDQ